MTDAQVPYYHIENNYAHHFRTFGNPTVAALAKLYRKGHKILDRTEDSAIYVKLLGEIEYVSEIEELPLSEWKHYKLLDDCVAKYYAIFVLQENSPYKRVFSKVTQRLVEGGLVSKLFDDLYKEKMVFMDEFIYFYDDGVQYKLIDLERMQGALLLLAVGWITSLVIFVLECLYFRRAQKKLGYLH